MSGWALKRFWDKAEAVAQEAGWGVALDGRLVRTPAKAPLILPGQALARAVAAEWQAQSGAVQPAQMPHTRMANAAIDKVSAQRRDVEAMLADYAGTDLVCYRAQEPDELVARQQAAWDPLLDWAATRFDARLVPAPGVMPRAQDDSALARLGGELAGFSDFELAALHDLVTLPGSLVIALAAAEGAWTPEELWEKAILDEAWQEEKWGQDEEAMAQRAHKHAAFMQAQRFFNLCNQP